MNNAKIFLDTNLWVYFYSNDVKSLQVEELISERFENIEISTQVLSELYSVLTRKKFKTQEDAQSIIHDIIESYPVHSIDEKCIQKAIEMNIRYHFSYWDSLIIATSILADCRILYSEDLQHNQTIEQQLTIVNPFL